VVFDTVGGDTTTKSFLVLKSGGVLVSMAGQPDEKLATQKGVKAIGQGTKPTTDKLQKIAELIDQGALKVNIDKVFPLDQAADALGYLKEAHPRGKVVIKIK